MRISKVSQVLEPSPLGVLRVEILRVLVGRRTIMAVELDIVYLEVLVGGMILTRSLDGERLALGTLNELLADLLERGNLAGAEGDTDLVDFL